jgi:hypothetical protein
MFTRNLSRSHEISDCKCPCKDLSWSAKTSVVV